MHSSCCTVTCRVHASARAKFLTIVMVGRRCGLQALSKATSYGGKAPMLLCMYGASHLDCLYQTASEINARLLFPSSWHDSLKGTYYVQALIVYEAMLFPPPEAQIPGHPATCLPRYLGTQILHWPAISGFLFVPSCLPATCVPSL